MNVNKCSASASLQCRGFPVPQSVPKNGEFSFCDAHIGMGIELTEQFLVN